MDLDVLHQLMQESQLTASKLMQEMPAIHSLCAKLKQAKPGTPEATKIHLKIRVHLESLGGRLFRGKKEHEKFLLNIKQRAHNIKDYSHMISRIQIK